MNKLEQLHFDNHDYRDAAEITEQIAIEFAEWLSSLIISNYKSGGNWYHKGMIYSSNMLFQEFLKTKQ